MKRYIEIFLGGRYHRFLIDDELDKELRKSLSTSYQFDSNNTLIIDENDLNNSYQIKQLILKSILNQIGTYDLDANLQRQIDVLKSYTDNKSIIYNSDLTKLESVLAEASEIYGAVRANLAKKEVAEEQRDIAQKNIEEIKTIIDSQDTENANTSDTISTTDDKIAEFKAILDDISYDETLREEVPINEIKDAMDRIVICSSMEEFIDKTGSNVEAYDIINAIKNKNEKIILPPNTKLEDVVVEVIKTNVRDQNILNKVVTYVERKASYQNKTDKALESLRSSLKIQGLSAHNLNYFGDQFFNEFERICNDTGISFETMFADYFNGYSENRKYNSPMDKFIRMYDKYNGGDENTRALLEAMLVKKAISRHLISSKYNNYLKDEYRNLEVNSKGYINFDESSFTRVSGGIDTDSHIDQNNNAYETELNMANLTRSGGIENSDSHNLSETSDDSITDAEILQASLAMNRRNKAIGGSVIASARGELNTTEETNSQRTILGMTGRPFTSNNSLNSVMHSDEEVEDEEAEEDNLASDTLENNGTSNDRESDNNSSDAYNDSDDSNESSGIPGVANDINDAIGDEINKKGRDTLNKAIIEFIKKNPWVLAVLGLIIFFFILILLLIASEEDKKNKLGYYEAACNFNDTKVTIVGCTNNDVLQTLELNDYVVRMAYLYTKDGSYSDEAIKALMIILKTNALGMGAYNSSNKNISVKICDAYSGVVDEASIFEGVEDKLTDLNKLYEGIKEYLFVSSSYKSSISSLGRANVISLNTSILNSLEEEAGNGKTYSEILSTLNSEDSTEEVTIYRDTLYIGDSRMHGILNASYINQNNTVYADDYGYNWFVGSRKFESDKTNATDGAINGIKAKIRDNASYNIVIWLGINDLENVNNYIEKYKELATGEWDKHNIYVVSLGPVLDNSSLDIKNENINSFNVTMKEAINNAGLNNLIFVDLGYSESSINNYDSTGVYYSNEDYKNIYDDISSNLQNELSSNLVLYRLSDYCTYYNLTENDAYWWPIGSSEATEGNIYGGTPVNSTITSTFGPRIHPITGVKQKAHGAIDIAVPRNTPIIATKSGTVTIASTGCTEGVLSCGGGYGNYIKLDHGEGIESLYAHLTSLVVKNGDVVKQGQIIAYSGTTGRSTGPHLHFEIRINGNKVDPLNYVNADNPRPINTLSPTVTGTNGDNRNMICSSLLASGFSKEATIGIMANLYAESSYNPINLQGSYEKKLGYTDESYTLAVDNGSYKNFTTDSAGYGLVQWTSGGRKLNFYNYAKERNTSIGNFDTQFNFMLKELENSYSSTYKYITSNHTAIEVGAYWCDHYESPGGSEPCSYHGNCPSQYCVNRTNNSINTERLTEYVNNGCKY